MKKILIIIMMLISIHIKAQITLDAIVVPQISIGDDFFTAQISPSETKYVYCDTALNIFNLYNMDFTPYLTNIAVPEPFKQGNGIFMRPIYITKSLFDCDTSNIEYAYECAVNSNKTFYIMRTDGTELFRLDSANGPYCFGDCLGGADWVKPIINTSEGAKLFLQRPYVAYGTSIYIYSLCGTLPTLPEEILEFSSFNYSSVKIFPNPTSGSLTFQIHPPDNMNDYELMILDNNAKEVKREKVNSSNLNYVLDAGNMSSGTYFYTICSKSKSYQSGKFIIAK